MSQKRKPARVHSARALVRLAELQPEALFVSRDVVQLFADCRRLLLKIAKEEVGEAAESLAEIRNCLRLQGGSNLFGWFWSFHLHNYIIEGPTIYQYLDKIGLKMLLKIQIVYIFLSHTNKQPLMQ